MNFLVLNAGSSSLKFSLFEADPERLRAEGEIDWGVQPAQWTLRDSQGSASRDKVSLHSQREAVAHVLHGLTTGSPPILKPVADLQAVAHRVVHGGDRFTTATLITPEVQQAIHQLSELAPLHNPVGLDVIRAAEKLLPGVPQVAAFDTAFHSTISESARTYALPGEWTRQWNLRRYGFHGLSHEYCSRRAMDMLGRSDARLIIAHLGNGASISAVRNGQCIDTSMGFTPLEGLMMGTRSGNVDPGLLLYLMREKHLTADHLDQALNHSSGLLGVSGISSDMREILKAAPINPNARLALDMYVRRIQQTIGAMAAMLGGMDALVFTAGVGENSDDVRQLVCERLEHLGITLDQDANIASKPDATIAAARSRAAILVIRTREDLTILRQARQALNLPPALTARSGKLHATGTSSIHGNALAGHTAERNPT